MKCFCTKDAFHIRIRNVCSEQVCVCVSPVCVCACVSACIYICVNMFLCLCLCLSAYQHICVCLYFSHLLYSIPCLSLATKTLTSSHLLILTSKHNEHIHMISSNIIINIFMQVFGACKAYNYITHLSTYTPTRSRANHRLVVLLLPRFMTLAVPNIYFELF